MYILPSLQYKHHASILSASLLLPTCPTPVIPVTPLQMTDDSFISAW
ncbi:MAG: hypothetical protein J6T52_08800 [Bacteroidaceae bacterium]|nr:hypothetical protein [Bacteroidaceae bacterium]